MPRTLRTVRPDRHQRQRLIERRQYDTIYHEHYSYFSLRTASRALETAGLSVTDVAELGTHGGSLRVYARPAEVAEAPSDRVAGIAQPFPGG